MSQPPSRFRPTRRSMQAAASLGMFLDHASPSTGTTHPHDELASQLLGSAAPISIIIGPSGAGKSTLLRRVAAAGRRADRRVFTIGLERHRERTPRNRPLVDLFDGSVGSAMRSLARAGLAEGACFVRRPSELSAGQFFRLRLALVMERIDRVRANGPTVLIIDEFAANLDAGTAWGVAALLKKFVTQTPELRVFIATPREELTSALAPARIIEIGVTHSATLLSPPPLTAVEARVHPPQREHPPLHSKTRSEAASFTPGNQVESVSHHGSEITISRGSTTDYHALAPLHYRAGAPATVVRVLVARMVKRTAESGQRAFGAEGLGLMSAVRCPRSAVVGVLLVSMPTLNGSWRRHAWPGVFDTGDKREDARRLNDHRAGVRCISRVIIDPRSRGVGLASRLVRAYLDEPLTSRTEAVAAMGRASSFFEHAGMTRYEVPVSLGDSRLMDLLEQFGIERWELSTPTRTYERARRRIGDGLLRRELMMWSRSSRVNVSASRGSGEMRSVFALACRRLGARPVAFAAEKTGRWHG